MSSRWRSGCLLLAIACALFYATHVMEEKRDLSTTLCSLRRGRTLILMTHSDTDPAYTENLDFFVRHGMSHQDTGQRDYIIVIQETETEFRKGKTVLPDLPKNAHYVFHGNSCYDWGTFGWAIRRLDIHITNYRYFIFMNTSVRGPFLPVYWPADCHWSDIFVSRLNRKVKLVGSTISCEGVPEYYIDSGEARQNPHVQSYAVATDQEGLHVLLDAQHVFECHSDIRHAIYHAELGSARAIFEAGYTIDSLMLRYQGIDWTNSINWNCNNKLNPYADQYYDGISPNPMEVLFVKYKNSLVDIEWPSMQIAAAYSRWMSQQGQAAVINTNTMTIDTLSPRLGRILSLMLRGNDCFDFAYFWKENPHFRDSGASLTSDQLWDDFVQRGQFRGDKFRFTCRNLLKNEKLVRHIIEDMPKFRNSTLWDSAAQSQAGKHNLEK